MTARSVRRLTSLLVALTVVAAACGGDDSGDDAATTEAPDESAATTTEAPDESAATTTESPPTSEAPASTTGAPTTTVELTDSFRGVTADTIKIGIPWPDWDALNAAGVANRHGSSEIAYQFFIDELNARGGILGRQIEPVYTRFDFLTTSTWETACLAVTEDDPVFLVMHGTRNDGNLCFTELHDTMVMTEKELTEARQEASGDVPWISVGSIEDATLELVVRVVAEAGLLEGRTIGIVPVSDALDKGEVIASTLSELGYESITAVNDSPAGDPVASAASHGVIAERFQTEGVDLVFPISDGGQMIRNFADVGFQPFFVYDETALLQAAGVNADGIEFEAVTVGPLPDDDLWNHPDFEAECLAPFREAHPELELKAPADTDEGAGEELWVVPLRRACYHVALFEEVATAAGPDLTNESFIAALEATTSFDFPGWGEASFGPGKYDGLDTFYLQEFDPDLGPEGGVVPIGDPITVER